MRFLKRARSTRYSSIIENTRAISPYEHYLIYSQVFICALGAYDSPYLVYFSAALISSVAFP